ncbi:MAG TPA: YdbL family protein [Pseudomonadales bacterium]|nr:YdbL family protein [Pseudomonadales bacterium]
MKGSHPGFLARLAALLLVALLAVPAAASPLDDAKAAGEIGEQTNGYLGIVREPGSAAIQALVASVNAERRARYESIAARNAITLEQVEMLAGRKAIEKTAAGNWIRLPDGTWTPR